MNFPYGLTRYNITGLTQGTKYYIRVSALNTLGYGTRADYQDAVPMTSSDPPGIPTTISQLTEADAGMHTWGLGSELREVQCVIACMAMSHLQTTDSELRENCFYIRKCFQDSRSLSGL